MVNVKDGITIFSRFFRRIFRVRIIYILPKSVLDTVRCRKNDEEKIGKCLEAIFNQTIKPHEVIVVDGYSKDNTVKIAEKYPVNILFESYGTMAGARQVGINKATGDFIALT